MDTRYFDEYLELVKRLNFTEAAKNLNMTQSALSKHIAALEKEFGSPLFRRSRQKVELTEAGRVLYARALVISENYHQAHTDIAGLKTRPPIHIAGILNNQEIINLLSHVINILGEESLEQNAIIPIVENQFMQLLSSKEVDLCICVKSPSVPEVPGVTFDLLYKDRFIALVSSTHHLAHCNQLSLKQCEDEVFLQLINDYSKPAWECIEHACHHAGFNPKKKSHLIQSALEYSTIPVGNTIYIMPELSLASSPLQNSTNLVRIPVSDDFAYFPLGIAFLSERTEEFSDLIGAIHEATSRMAEEMLKKGKRSAPFRERCNHLALEAGLSNEETRFLLLYAKGNQLDRISEIFNCSAEEVNALLAVVLTKTGLSNRQDLIDRIDNYSI